MKKKLLISLILVFVFSITALSVTAFAADVVESGDCNEKVSYTIDTDGVLTVSARLEAPPT